MTFGHGIVIKNGSHGRGVIAHELAQAIRLMSVNPLTHGTVEDECQRD